MTKKQVAKNENKSTLTFIKPSKVRLSKDGNYMLLFLGSAVLSIHKNYAKAIFANKKRSA